MTNPAPGTTDYDEFEISLFPRDGRTFTAHARFGGRTETERFVLPVAPEELPALRAMLSQEVIKRAGTVNQQTAAARGSFDFDGPASGPMTPVTPRKFGVQLYDALFTGRIRTLFDSARSTLRARGSAGVRLRLRFADGEGDSGAGTLVQIMSLPWEMLAPSENDNPLVISTSSPLVRSFDGDDNPTAPFAPPIKVLAIAASPANQAKLDLAAEEQRMREAWGTLPSVRFRFVQGRLPLVRTALEEYQPHVLHFMGHGDLVGDEGVLLFEGADGMADPVDARRLGALFGDQSPLRLVFLNSCRGAETGTSPNSSPFAGVATRLVREGIPAVIAMQFPVTDPTALEFSREFYTRLVNGLPIDSAVSEARKTVFLQGTGEWATPVLFLRPRDGALFHRERVDPLPVLKTLVDANAIEVFAPEGAADGEPFVVFIATTSGKVRDWVDRAIRDMRSNGMTVVTARQLPWDGYHRIFEQLAACCDLFLHILGPQPGNEIDGRAEYHAVEQFNIGFEGAKSQLVIFPQGTPKTSADPDYNALLERITTCPREPERMEWIECDKDALLAHIIEHRDLLLSKEALDDDAQVFVDVHARDRDDAAGLLADLDARGIRYVLPPTPDDVALDPVLRFQQTVRSVPLMLVLAGQVDGTWVLQRLREGMKAAVDRDPPTRLIVLRLPGSGTLPRVPYYAAVYGDESGYSPKVLDLVLDGLAAS